MSLYFREMRRIRFEEFFLIGCNQDTNVFQPVSKRRVALLRSLGRHFEAIMALNTLLDMSPSDAEAWAELAELYIYQGHYQQGIFALEEVLLIAPNAWNVSTKSILSLYRSASKIVA
jgi:ER membrane protein complex subunit 2